MPNQGTRRVVCLHGLRRTPADWAGVEAGLGPGWKVEAPALPGDPDEALAAADAAIEPGDTVFAHSMGAVVAQRLARGAPRPLNALVLTGSFFPPARNGRSRSGTVLDYAGHRAAFVREAMRGGAGERSAGSPRALRMLLRQAAARREAGEPIDVGPVLVVHARDDHHVPVDFAIAAARSQPGWSLRILESGGHNAHAERPELWLAAVMPWLDEMGARAPCRSSPGSERRR